MRSFQLVPAILSAAAIVIGTLAAPAPVSELTILEKLQKIPHGWEQKHPPAASKRLRFRIALRQENAYAFEQHVIDISTPDHAKYGQHMDRTELKRMLQPSEAASSAVLGWLKSQGVPDADIEDDGDWINFYVPTVEAERILDTRFYYYSNSISDINRIRTLHYSVPANLHQYIQMIQVGVSEPLITYFKILIELRDMSCSLNCFRHKEMLTRKSPTANDPLWADEGGAIHN